MHRIFPSTAVTEALHRDRLWSGPRPGAEIETPQRFELPPPDPG
ncbi:MAG: hypothetical protein ABJN42_13775 [Roseibium sp.]